METVLFIVSIWLFVTTFGLKMHRDGSIEFDQPDILRKRFMVVMPYISGFVLPIIPFAILLPVHWIILFVLNHLFVYIAGPFLTKVYRSAFAWGRGMGRDMLNAFVGGIVALTIGLIIRYHLVLGSWIKALSDRII